MTPTRQEGRREAQQRVARLEQIAEGASRRVALEVAGDAAATLVLARGRGRRVLAWLAGEGGEPSRSLDAFVSGFGDIVVWLPADLVPEAWPASDQLAVA